MISLSKQSNFVTKRCVLTFRTEAPQGLRLGGGHISQPQCALIEILVGEQVGETHSGGVLSDV